MKTKVFLLLIFLFSFFTQNVFAEQVELSRDIIFKFISKEVLTSVPKSSQYIELNFLDVSKTDKNYTYIQKIVYADLIENKKSKLLLKEKLNAYVFYSLLEKAVDFDFVHDKNTKSLKARNVYNTDLVYVDGVIKKLQNTPKVENVLDREKAQIFLDVYQTILRDHYNSAQIKKEDLMYGSIEWLALWSQDKFTTYFPPTESKGFQESLNGEFEWIWAHVEMLKPGELKIISPLSGSPAEKAGLKWWDIIIKVWEVQITKSMTANEIVAMIKWKAGTIVKIQVLRAGEKLDFDVTRAKIVINDVEYKVLNGNIFYIQMKMFGEKVFTQTSEAMTQLKKESNIKKVVIDLRNNPGWYLDQAVDILSMFTPKWSPVAVVKYKNWESVYKSYWYDTIDLSGYEVYILANSGTASASEILIWTLKDYFPNIKIIGEKTYGKWSVQTMKQYQDGSLLKYTIAKWYTGKTQTGIDGIWISPDIEVVLDVEKFKNWVDTQLDYIVK